MTNKLKNLFQHTNSNLLDKHINKLSVDTQTPLFSNLPDRLISNSSKKHTKTPHNEEDSNEFFYDVQHAIGLSIIPDTDIFHTLYGKFQGRYILEKICKTKIKNIIIIAPSYLKKCGIGEYARYLEQSFKENGKSVLCLRTSTELLSLNKNQLTDTLVLVNHGPGLFDGFNPKLSQGESTTGLISNLTLSQDMGALPVFLLHSLIDTDQALLFSRQQMILNSSIPTITFVSSAAEHFYIPSTELGISPVENPVGTERTYEDRSTSQENIGFFGFFQYGGKDFDSLIHLAKSLRAKLVGSVAVNTKDEADKLKNILSDSDISHEFGTGWVSDSELAERLSTADYFYLPQNDYDHWNNSATARFVMNFDKPIFLPPYHPFLDAMKGVIFATKEDLPRVVAHYREQINYDRAVTKTRRFKCKADMRNTAKSLMGSAVDSFVITSKNKLAGFNEKSLQRYFSLDASCQQRYLDTISYKDNITLEDDLNILMETGAFDSVYESVNPLQFWRKHYEISDFVQHSVFEGIHNIYLSINKEDISFEKILRICQIINKNHSFKPADLLAHSIHDALNYNNKNSIFNTPKLAIFHGKELLRKKDITSSKIDDVVNFIGNNINYLRSKPSGKNKYSPTVENIFELITLPAEELSNRKFPVSLDSEELTADLTEALQEPFLYQRLNLVCSVLTSHNIDISNTFLFDHLLVRTVEPVRLNYIIEDFIFYDGDDFILNAIRSLNKRNPFPIEYYTLNQMLENLGKVPVLTYLSSHPSSKATINTLDTSLLTLSMDNFSHFVHHIRDPLFGGIDRRNEYLVNTRHNHRWKLDCLRTIDEYYAAANGEYQAILAAYNLLSKLETDYQWNQNNTNDTGCISSWMTTDGQFFDISSIEKNMLTIAPDEAFNIFSLSEKKSASLIGFHEIEADGAWTKGKNARIVVGVNLQNTSKINTQNQTAKHNESNQLGKQSSQSFFLTLRMRLFGSEFSPARTVCINIASYKTGQRISTETQTIESDDTFSALLKIPLDSIENKLVIELSVSDTACPSTLIGSADSRNLGIMVQQLSLQQFPVSLCRRCGIEQFIDY